ncbi:MAG: pyruvate, phosphate dikinase/phosphoenolpyruvate synthase regulator, partial [Syntrophales bacterium]|nr:pyruvate, phosphate dikinase/phosphoenolpyruvate synthase regulator [Syntrophales bacterium]
MMRSVFYISDGTGITAETLGHTLLTQFPDITFQSVNLPFVNTTDKVDRAIQRINKAAEKDGMRPLVFTTLTNTILLERLSLCKGEVLDFLAAFKTPMEKALGVPSTPVVGRSHGIGNPHIYTERIDALHYALQNDDGSIMSDYTQADIVVMGVSRTGKTPTCLYLALQFGIQAANYPLTDDDFERGDLPPRLEMERSKLFGLTVGAERLYQIRQERRADSLYASMKQVRTELRSAENL